MKLPNAAKAVVDIQKLTDHLFRAKISMKKS